MAAPWDGDDLWLVTPAKLPNGFVLTCIDNDTRFGHLAYGAKENIR